MSSRGAGALRPCRSGGKAAVYLLTWLGVIHNPALARGQVMRKRRGGGRLGRSLLSALAHNCGNGIRDAAVGRRKDRRNPYESEAAIAAGGFSGVGGSKRVATASEDRRLTGDKSEDYQRISCREAIRRARPAPGASQRCLTTDPSGTKRLTRFPNTGFSSNALRSYNGTPAPRPSVTNPGRVTKSTSVTIAIRSWRHTVHLWANLSRHDCPWAETYYQALRQRGKSNACALRCRGQRWLKILWKMWQTRTQYDAELHQKNQLRHGSWVLKLQNA